MKKPRGIDEHASLVTDMQVVLSMVYGSNYT